MILFPRVYHQQVERGLCTWEALSSVDKKDMASVIVSMHAAAKDGNMYAQYIFGTLHDTGICMPRDHKQAAHWFEKAALKGYFPAMYDMSTLYDCGQGVPQNNKKSLFWLRKAAMFDAEAAFRLGGRYELGHNVKKDVPEACKWYLKAASFGHAEAQHMITCRYESGDGVPQSFEEAVRWSQVAADQGYAPAQTKLGYFKSQGIGTYRSMPEAIRLYTLGAKQGFGPAQANLGLCYRKGNGVPRDLAKATEMLSLAVENGVLQVKEAYDACRDELAAQTHSSSRVVSPGNNTPRLCSNCGASEDAAVMRFQSCGRCKKAAYCSRECQHTHWKEGNHKKECAAKKWGEQAGSSLGFPVL
jgi:TPR repeat protein